MKNVSVEEVEAKEMDSILLEDIMQEDVNKARELCGDNFIEMYNDWVCTHGQVDVRKWLADNEGKMTGYEGISRFSQYLMKCFITYLEA